MKQCGQNIIQSHNKYFTWKIIRTCFQAKIGLDRLFHKNKLARILSFLRQIVSQYICHNRFLACCRRKSVFTLSTISKAKFTQCFKTRFYFHCHGK